MSVFTPKHFIHDPPYALQVWQSDRGDSHYLLVNLSNPTVVPVLELGIARDGRAVDYLRLDKFWGHVPRPMDVGGSFAGELPTWVTGH